MELELIGWLVKGRKVINNKWGKRVDKARS